MISGLSYYANKGHLARAVLEAAAFQTREVVEAMEKDSNIQLKILLMQFQSDLDQSPVIKETTALGAAYAAGRAIDWKKAVNRSFDWIEPS